MDSKNALIIGRHPLAEDVKKQYSRKGFRVHLQDENNEYNAAVIPDEIFIATMADGTDSFALDNRSIKLIRDICDGINEGSRIPVHILLHSHDTFTLFQQRDIDKDLRDKVEIFPFTIESIWSQRLAGCTPADWLHFPALDREPITADSLKTIHLVISGMNSMAIALAVNTALTCHVPNYTRNHALRTRITLVDKDMDARKNDLIHRYQALFDNSWYRFIDLSKTSGSGVTFLHRPDYCGTREDFVDVEWEFVTGSLSDGRLYEKLKKWSSSERQLLTLALCDENESVNIRDLIQLPKELEDNNITIFTRLNDSSSAIVLNGRKNIRAFGMPDCGYDISLPLIRIAKMVNHVYDCCYEYNYGSGSSESELFSPVSIDREKMDRSWAKLSNAKKWSNIYNAMTLGIKMRSLGHPHEDWGRFFALSSQEISLIAEVEHNRWSIEEMLLGFRPANRQEELEIEADIRKKKAYKERFIHYDLRAYKDLRPDESGRNVNTYDLCLSSAIPLIAGAFMEEENNG